MTGQKARINRGFGAVRGVFLFVLLASFAIMSLAAVLIGAKVLKSLQTRSGESYQTRTTLAYIAGKVRSSDRENAVSTGLIGGTEMLMLSQEYGGTEYITCIYAWGGSLREYFGRADSAFAPGDGESIADAESFSVLMEGNRLHICVAGSGRAADELTLYIQSGGDGA